MKVELADCTNTLIREIQDKKFKQKNIATTYALAILSSEEKDWKKINESIIDRWSYSGLNNIKRIAFNLIEKDFIYEFHLCPKEDK